jgi:ribosomal-protein-alanine N-acetyltransferase
MLGVKLMKFTYETDRLILRVLDSSWAPQVLDFYQNNPDFARVEPTTDNFYTLHFHETVLRYEYELTLKMSMLRLWIFSKDDPAKIIGTVSFRNITRSFFGTCEVGYKMDHEFRNQGYCQEALSRGFEVMFSELNLHRIEAIVLPSNLASIHLLEKLGFKREGVKRQCVKLQGEWRDHYLYSLLSIDSHPARP